MRRFWAILTILLVFSLACQTLVPDRGDDPSPTPVPVTPAPATSPPPTTEIPPAPVLPLQTSTPSPTADQISPSVGYTVRTHPDGSIYVGDLVSLEVIAPPGAELEGKQVRIEAPVENSLGPVEFNPHGIGGRMQATFNWAWNTAGVEPGEYKLSVSVIPDGTAWEETILLQPNHALPPPEPWARWETTESDCCLVYYITGTEAERDLAQLLDLLDNSAASASGRLGTDFKEPIPFTFLPRVLGHGGFTSDEIAVSYLDRNYAGSDPGMVIHHEMVHLLDGRLGGELRPTLLVEGLAVYLSGGHFKPEPLLPRAATLLAPQIGCAPAVETGMWAGRSLIKEVCGLDRYLPLAELVDNFYTSQHEIGYLQAGALIEFMVEEWGWEAFAAFYRDMKPQQDGMQSTAMDAALQEHFNLGLEALERRFLERLETERVSAELAEDVRLTVEFYDTVRRYQQALDSSAYFLTAWLPDLKQMREKGIVADLLRHPDSPENRALEELLVSAGAALRAGDYARTARLLEAVNASLNVFEGQ